MRQIEKKNIKGKKSERIGDGNRENAKEKKSNIKRFKKHVLREKGCKRKE